MMRIFFLLILVLKVFLSMIYKIIIFNKLLKLILLFIYNIKYYVLFFIFISGLLVFCSIRKHLLLTLLRLEYLVLCIFIFINLYIMGILGDIYIILVFLTFSVCEGVLGLSILVTIIRRYGNDQVGSLFLSKW